MQFLVLLGSLASLIALYLVWKQTTPADASISPSDPFTPQPDLSTTPTDTVGSILNSIGNIFGGSGSSPLSGTGLPLSEDQIISDTASRVGVDARLLAAIRVAENGGPGREFGVLSVSAPDYQSQAQIAARSIQNNQQRYESATGQSATDSTGRFTESFIAFMGQRWAPIGAGNDPSGLNINWIGNVASAYGRINYVG